MTTNDVNIAANTAVAGYPGWRDITMRNGTRWLVTPEGKWLVNLTPAPKPRKRLFR